MIKTCQSKSRGCASIQSYLRQHGRSLAFDFAACLGEPQDWGHEMDEARTFAGKDSGRRYYHFILSPDPRDHATLPVLRRIAVAWAEENYPGRQWAIEYHDDNKSGILHAHVVLNAFDCETGRKVHRTDAKCRREARSFNRLKAEAGLTPMADVAEISRPRRLTRAELDLRARGIVPYKDRLREAIGRAAALCGNFAQFQRVLSAQGIKAYLNARGQVVYVPPAAWGGHPCKDIKLGADYTYGALARAFAPDLGRQMECRIDMPPFARPTPRRATYADLLAGRARGFRQARIDRLASALSTIRAQSVSCASDLDAKIAEAVSQIALAEESVANLNGAYAAVKASLEDAETLRRYERIWAEYESANKRGREQVARRYPEAVSACVAAARRLEDRGIEGEAARMRLTGLATEGLSRLELARVGLTGAKASLEALRAARRVVADIDARRACGDALRAGLRTGSTHTPSLRAHRGAGATVLAEKPNTSRALRERQEARAAEAARGAEAPARETAREQARTRKNERER